MANVAWVIDMDDQLLSIIKGKTIKKIKADYPKVFYTNDNANNTSAEFPTIYLHLIGSPESANTLEADEIESATFTFEVQIKHNDTAEDVKNIAIYIIQAFKELRFQMVTNLEPQYIDGIYTATYRFRREIASGDKLV